MKESEKLQKALDEMVLRFPKYIDQLDNSEFIRGFIAGWNTGNMVLTEKVLVVLEEHFNDDSEFKNDLKDMIKMYMNNGEPNGG